MGAVKKREKRDLALQEFFSEIYPKIKEEKGPDHFVFVMGTVESDRYRYYEMAEGRESVREAPDPRSIVFTALETTQPIVANMVSESFIYNPEVDNPFDFSVENITAIPLVLYSEEKQSVGVLLLYKKKKFLKERLIRIKKTVDKAVASHRKMLWNYVGEREEKRPSKNFDRIELEKANNFFSSVIHDIRTPMNAVMGFLELLGEEAEGQQKEYINAAYKSSEMVIALINDVLDISKLSMGKVDMDFHFFSPMDELENTALLFYHSAIKKGIDFLVWFDPKIPFAIKSDPYRFKQIINNLLSNAIKFTPEGGEIALELHYDEQRDSLTVEVRDTGIGISEEAQKHIFQPFRQASESTSGQYGGTGLGLSISKQLAALLGGELSVRSAEGRGSTFSLTIPCRTVRGTPASIEVRAGTIAPICFVRGKKGTGGHLKYFKKYFEALEIPYREEESDALDALIDTLPEQTVYILVEADYTHPNFSKIQSRIAERLIVLETSLFPEIPDPNEALTMLHLPIFPKRLFRVILQKSHKESVEKRESAQCRPRRVLLVDDNIINLKLMREVTRRLGHEVYTAENGAKAVELFDARRVDVVLIDKNMPVMDGTEAIRRIRKLEGGSEAMIFGLTGESDPGVLKEMIDAGADDILGKPVKIDRLKQVMCRER